MNSLMNQIKNVVPKGMKIVAAIVIAAALICATVFAFMSGVQDAHATRNVMTAPVASGLGLFVATVVAAWLLLLGYVYGDAKRRGMPPVIWSLVAIMVPNMVGFILYFALRKPLLSICSGCGQSVASGQKFCPSCGREQNSTPSSSSSSSIQPSSMSLSQKSSTVMHKSYAIGFFVWTGIFFAKAMLAYWKHETVNGSGLMVLATVCALLAMAVTQQRLVRQ
jgi:hypothetical protein